MDVNRLRQGEQIAAIAAIVLLVDMFIFKWFGLEVSGAGALGISAEGSKNAWGSMDLISWILFITVLATLGMAYLRASDTEVDLPVSTIVVVLGGLSTLLILFRLISPPDFTSGDLPAGIDHTRKIGAYIGFIAAAVLTYGAWQTMQEEDTSFGDAADRLGGGGGVGEPGPSEPTGGEPPSAPPPPPPPPPPSGGTPPSV
jgi:hypothetical protein